MSRRAAWLYPLLLLLLLSFALRVYRLDGQSLWADEGNSVAMATRLPLDIVQRTARDIHPPLYYITLSAWSRFVGTSAFAVRTLSVTFSVLTVALTAALGQRVGGRRGALFAAAAGALSPFALHYAQETRMYAMVAMLGAASWLLGAQSAKRRAQSGQIRQNAKTQRGKDAKGWGGNGNRQLPTVGYWVVTVAMLYTHYYAVSLLLAQNLFWFWTFFREKPQIGNPKSQILRWLFLQSTLALAYLPWLWYARATLLGWPATSEPLTLPFLARELFRIFSIGQANDGLPTWAALGFGVLLAAAILGKAQSKRQKAKSKNGMEPAGDPFLPLSPSLPLPVFYCLIPPALMFLLSLDRPFWNPKFLLLALPGYHLLLAQGVATLLHAARRLPIHNFLSAPLSSLLSPLLFAFLLLAPLPSLRNELTDPRFARDDYRGMARLIAAGAGPHDAVLLDGAGQREVFDLYFGESLPRYGLPAAQPLDEAVTVAALERIAAQHERLWVLWWAEEEGDPARVIPRWLEAHAFEAGSRWFGNVRLASYRLGEPPPPQPLDVGFRLPEGGGLRLTGASLEPTEVVAGEVLALHSTWALSGTVGVPITFFAQLLDGGNHLVGQWDGLGGALSVPEWERNDTQTVRVGVPVTVGTPPGDYRLIIGAYHADTGQRLLTAEGDAFGLGTVRVLAPALPPTLDALPLLPGEGRNTRFGGATLVGARANRLGSEHAPETPLAPGEPLAVLLFWRGEDPAPTLPPLTLRLRDASGRVAAEWPLDPSEGRYPPARWSPGELIRDPQVRFLPSDLTLGGYRLTLEAEGLSALVGTVQVGP